MLLLFFLLATFCSVDALYYLRIFYGESYRIMLTREAETLEVVYKNTSDPVILWNRTNPLLPENSTRRMVGRDIRLDGLTQSDEGHYITRDKTGLELEVYYFTIEERTRYFHRKAGETFSFSFNLDPKSCNVYFVSESKAETIKMVSSGTVTGDVSHSGCSYLKVEQPCEVTISHVEVTCKGQFEFRDRNDNRAFVASLGVTAVESKLSPVGITLGVLSALSACCGCIKFCCCGGCSSKKEEGEEGSPETEPAVEYKEGDSETVRIQSDDSAPDAYNSSQPSSKESGPLMQTSPVAIKSSEGSGSGQKAIQGPSSFLSGMNFLS